MSKTGAFKNKLEQFRNHYKSTYGIEMDDETLYFFIRVNEMQIALSKQIKEIPKVKFDKSSDYFLYGMGMAVRWVIIISIGIILITCIVK